MKTLTATVTAPDDGKRLDLFLAAQELGLSRRKLRQVIDVGGVYVNKKRVRIASWEVRRGDVVRVEYSEAALVSIKTRAFAFTDADLLWEGDDVFALAKPPGLPAQATKDQSVQHVVPLLGAWLRTKGRQTKKLLLVHRLDKETSGIILVAAGGERTTWMTDQFRERKVKKTYLAICYGRPQKTEWTESAPLSEIDKKTGDVRAVRSGGRSALTHFKVLATSPTDPVCFVECRPETGRSHQIRVHLELAGLPIVGDKRYGASSRVPLPSALAELAAEHHFLHAAALVFQPSSSASLARVTCDPPPRFLEFARVTSLQVPTSAGK